MGCCGEGGGGVVRTWPREPVLPMTFMTIASLTGVSCVQGQQIGRDAGRTLRGVDGDAPVHTAWHASGGAEGVHEGGPRCAPWLPRRAWPGAPRRTERDLCSGEAEGRRTAGLELVPSLCTQKSMTCEGEDCVIHTSTRMRCTPAAACPAGISTHQALLTTTGRQTSRHS